MANSAPCSMRLASAGVERIVHVSITHPSISSPYGYFRGKAEAERALAEVGVPYAVLRPAILFGGDGVLLNNIAWLLRRLPVFAVGGSGRLSDPRRAHRRSRCAGRRGRGGARRHGRRRRGSRASDLPRARAPSAKAVGSRSVIVRVPGVADATVGLSPRAGPARRPAHRRRVPRHGRRSRRHRRPGNGVHCAQRVDPSSCRFARSALCQRDRPALPAARGLSSR